MRFPNPHLTADNLLVAPVPIIDPEIAWVVLTGIPNHAIDVNIVPPAVSAQKPWYGFNLVSLNAIVLTIRHPLKKVPSAIADAAASMTGIGTTKAFECKKPPANNNAVIM